MEMNNMDLSDLHNKLDKIFDVTSSNSGDLKAVNEHLKTLNGKVLKNMIEIEKNGTETYKKQEKCDSRIEKIKKDINDTENNIIFARGSIYGLSFLSIILTIALGTKSLGFW